MRNWRRHRLFHLVGQRHARCPPSRSRPIIQSLPGTLTLADTICKMTEFAGGSTPSSDLSAAIHVDKRLRKNVDPYLDQLAAASRSRRIRPGDDDHRHRQSRGPGQRFLHALEKSVKNSPSPARILVHSRFPPLERRSPFEAIKRPGEKIIIATQAIEAGVDISCTHAHHGTRAVVLARPAVWPL